MGMTKEQQKAASDRIMEKMGPLTDDERKTYDRLVMKPEDYPKSDKDYRECQECGAQFETVRIGKPDELTAFQQWSDHLTNHNPSGRQWSEAHKRIQDAKEVKKSDQSTE